VTAAIESLEAAGSSPTRLVVVDNASSDDTLDVLSWAAPSATVTLIPFCLAAMANAKPAGPPPITNTSDLSLISLDCPRRK